MTDTPITINDPNSLQETSTRGAMLRGLSASECEQIDGGIGLLLPHVCKVGEHGSGPPPRYGCFVGVTC